MSNMLEKKAKIYEVKEGQVMKHKDYFKNPNVVSVPGTCKKCGEYHFLNKEKVCLQCRLK